jgi:predicted RNA-binding Zn-ribbon protein involved in translation (DUF1610 family)
MTERGLVQADCPTCGAVIAEASALACGVSEADEAGLCEFPCPTCDHRLLIPISPIEISSLLLLGAHKTRSLPFELLEAHSGSPVSWDETLDLHIELEGGSFPQQELAPGRAA